MLIKESLTSQKLGHKDFWLIANSVLNKCKESHMVKKVITNLDSSMASGHDFIPLVVLKNCEPELTHILVELFNMCLKEFFSRLLEGLIGDLCI